MLPLEASKEQRDLELCQKCISVLDQEFSTQYQGPQELDMMVKYMWRVFGYSFYGGVRAEDERCLALKSFQYLRQPAVDKQDP